MAQNITNRRRKFDQQVLPEPLVVLLVTVVSFVVCFDPKIGNSETGLAVAPTAVP